MKPGLSLLDRLYSHTLKTETCWLWQAAKISTGYGVLRVDGRNVLAHRLSFQAHTGTPVPDGACVLHRCDTPACLNPEHLFLGTKADNVHDMDQKGRRKNNPPRGERASHAKLTEDKVREIRRRAATGESSSGLAAEFGVDPSMIWLINTRRSWRHVA